MTILQEKIVNTMSNLKRFSFTEVGKLLAIRSSVQFKNFIENIKVASCYYASWTFLKADLLLMRSYLFNNPFSISKHFLRQKGEEDIYAYGETPLTTLNLIMRECRVESGETVFELGCGRGRTCFWLNAYYGCKVVGIDQIPEFIDRGNQIVDKLDLSSISFIQQDMLDADLSSADTIYLYGTCLQDDFIKKLTKKFAQLRRGTKIITVSYALSDYDADSHFELMRCFSVKLTWGEADVYLQVVK
ncbi:MAG: SAM-dependent methyltransferase [Parachlamydiaceae bacterium]